MDLARRGARALARLRVGGPGGRGAVPGRARAPDEPGQLGAALRRDRSRRRPTGAIPPVRRAESGQLRTGFCAPSSRSWRCGALKVVLLRHGECLGNVDESAYTRIPDHALPLTAHGEAQATAAGPRIKELVGDARLGVLRQPLPAHPAHARSCSGCSPAWTVQEPRLREQDWGNLQDLDGQRRQEEERNFFGHFFYRLSHGESGADVDDRLAAFLTELRLAPPDADALLVVTHGLAMRLLARRALGWSVALFEALSNPDPCEERVLTLDGGRWQHRPPVRAVEDRRRRDDPVVEPRHPTRGARRVGTRPSKSARGSRGGDRERQWPLRPGAGSGRSNISRSHASRLVRCGAASR